MKTLECFHDSLPDPFRLPAIRPSAVPLLLLPLARSDDWRLVAELLTRCSEGMLANAICPSTDVSYAAILSLLRTAYSQPAIDFLLLCLSAAHNHLHLSATRPFTIAALSRCRQTLAQRAEVMAMVRAAAAAAVARPPLVTLVHWATNTSGTTKRMGLALCFAWPVLWRT